MVKQRSLSRGDRLGCGSVAECMPGIRETLCSVLSTTKPCWTEDSMMNNSGQISKFLLDGVSTPQTFQVGVGQTPNYGQSLAEG